MAERIPQGVAIRVPLQAFLASNHFSPATGLTTNIVITISKNGGAYAATNAAETSHEIASGSYYADLDATDTGTVGPLFVRGADVTSTIDPITTIYNVVAFVDQTGDSFSTIGAAGAGLTAASAALLTTAITESYRANGAAPTLAQFACEVLAHLGEASIVDVTKTIKKLDHAASAGTFTLNSATVPTSITRAT